MLCFQLHRPAKTVRPREVRNGMDVHTTQVKWGLPHLALLVIDMDILQAT